VTLDELRQLGDSWAAIPYLDYQVRTLRRISFLEPLGEWQETVYDDGAPVALADHPRKVTIIPAE